MSELFPVLHEDDEILVLHKPAGLVCHPTKGDALSSLISRVRLHLSRSGANWGDREPQMVHRLDRETSGVMIFGKTDYSALHLRKLWEEGLVTKEYWAIVHGHLLPDRGIIDFPIGKDDGSEIAIKDKVRADGASARTRWWVIRRFQTLDKPFSLVRIHLDTGRKHQIRIHFSHVGHAIVGDKLYGADESAYLAFVYRRLSLGQKAQLMVPCQALHAARIWLPWEGVEREFHSKPEPWFHAFLEGEVLPWTKDPFDPGDPSVIVSS
jgi:23S rRNA pseudouridine1911/1915/1917 synthase